jgi:recombinational DNA repair ATPase RecF
MSADGVDQRFVRQMRERLESSLVHKEIEILEYWLMELGKIYDRRHQSIAALHVDIQNLCQKMRNRLKILRSKLPNLPESFG